MGKSFQSWKFSKVSNIMASQDVTFIRAFRLMEKRYTSILFSKTHVA